MYDEGTAELPVRRRVLPKGKRLLEGRELLVGAAAGVLAAGVLVAAVLLFRHPSSFPADVRKQASFPLYYPTQLPGGFTIDPTQITYDSDEGVLMVPVLKNGEQQITITEQAMAGSLSFSDLQGDSKAVQNAPGKAVLGDVEGRKLASLITSDNRTLIFITSNTASNDQMTALVQHLQRTR